ncbi:MAG: carbohydrate-binding protein [Saccharothrix sp.]|nr:carbohydrate-binding protein [Saccharothrix sp.]
MSTKPGRRRRLIAAAAAMLVALPAALALNADASVPSTPSGWTLRWSDDFTGNANTLPSSQNWIFDTGHGYPGGAGNWGTGEIQNYTTDTRNIALDGSGNLRITALRDSSGAWTSGRIETQRADFKPPAGGKMAIEGRVQMPSVTGSAALGYWPAFWALGSPYRGNYWNWPGIGELDVMENVNGVNKVWGTLHCGVNPGGACNETTGLGSSVQCPNTSCTGNFHTYRFEWDASVSPQVLRWYVDGRQFHSVSQSQLDSTSWNNMASHSGYFLLLNLAIGGAFPDAIAGFTTPTSATVPGYSMLVDYVAVWTTGSGSTNPTTTTTTGTGGTGWSAYSEIQAEQATSRSGGTLESTSDTGGGQDVGKLKNGDSLRFSGVRFGSTTATQFIARAASGAGGAVSGLVEVRIGSPTATPVGSFAIANTGGWQYWRTIPANMAGVTGTQDVYLTFTSGQPSEYVSVNWIKFS